jgi:protein O-mannosyl-transferase
MTPAWLRDRRLVAWGLFLVALVVYLPAVLGGTFHYDDFHSIRDNEGVRTLANIPRFFQDPQLWSGEPGNAMYRPTLLVTYALDFALWQDRASGWLLTNAVVHALCVVLVHRLALRIGLSDVAAAFAGAVFALHPAISEVQNYVSSRSESVAALLMLGALHLHLSGRVATNARFAALTLGALALSFLALLSKETTAGFCVAVALFEWVRRRGGERETRGSGMAAVYAAGLVVALTLRALLVHHATADVALVGAPKGSDPRLGGSLSIVDNVLKVQSRVVVLYGQLLLKPVGLNIDHGVERLATWSAAAFASLAIHASIVAAAVASFLGGRRLLFLCVGWFWVFLAPSVAFPLNVVMNEHRLYLPMIAVALLAGAALARVAEVLASRRGSASAGLAIAAAPLLCFVPLIVQRSREWRDDETLWTTAVERSPESPLAHMHLGATWHLRANETMEREERVRLLDAALAEYGTSAAMLPGWGDVQFNIGQARLTRGQATHDRADFEASLAALRRWGDIVGPDQPRPLMHQATAMAELGAVDGAIAIVRGLKSRDPSRTTLYDEQLARFLHRKGDKAGAADAMERVIALEEPLGRVDGLLTLGWWLFEDGDLERAESYLTRALTIARRTGDRRPPLYVARFLRLVGQGDSPTMDEMEKLARRFGWSAPAAEVAWVLGGPTPGVFSGTAPWRPPR